MRPYTVFINEQALAAAPRSGTQLESVMRFIRALADNPNTAGDFTEKDNANRVLQVKIIGRYAVTFWGFKNAAFCRKPLRSSAAVTPTFCPAANEPVRNFCSPRRDFSS